MSALISIIVSIDEKNGIGKKNQLLFKISKDLKRFKKLTLNHPIIMGRVTHQSIGKILPQRPNIIITRDKNFKSPGAHLTHSLDQAITLAKSMDSKEIFIIGGGQIFKQAMAQDIVDRLYLTQVKGDYQADVFFPDYSNFTTLISKTKNQAGDYQFTYLTLEK